MIAALARQLGLLFAGPAAHILVGESPEKQRAERATNRVALTAPALIVLGYACRQLDHLHTITGRPFWVAIAAASAGVYLIALREIGGGRGMLWGGWIWLLSAGYSFGLLTALITTISAIAGILEGKFDGHLTLTLYVFAVLVALPCAALLKRVEAAWIADEHPHRRVHIALVAAITTFSVVMTGVHMGWFAHAGAPRRVAMEPSHEWIETRGTGRTILGRIDAHNQCFMPASVNGISTELLVDTGAALFSMDRAAAQRFGIDPANLDFNIITSTANGNGRAARIVLGELRLGDIVLHNMPADVDNDGAPYPLLAMSVMKFARLELTRTSCVLRW